MQTLPKIDRAPRIGTLREQRPAWTTYLAQRRRSRISVPEEPPPPFSPTQIAGLKLWLDAAIGTSASVGEPVTQWDDQSGLGNHAVQGEVTQQALLQMAGAFHVLRFDEDDGYATPLVLNHPCTVFAIYSVASAAELARRAVQGSVNWLIGPYGPVHEFFHGGAFSGGPTSTVDQLAAQAAWQDGVNSRNFVNGAFVGSTLDAGAAPETIYLGASGAFPEGLGGDLAEVLAYDSALSDPDMAAVWSYLAAKYQLS